VTAYGLFMLPEQQGRGQPTEHPVMSELGQEDEAAGVLQRLERRANRVRSWVRARPGGAQIWRGGVAVVGLVVIIVGIVLLAAPGPGWLVIFVGLGIWATEFAWARSLLRLVRRTVGRWTGWLGRQPRWLSVLVGAVGLIALGAVAAGAWLLVAKH
jgi:uncharacterized protein (TIGR02611 family)